MSKINDGGPAFPHSRTMGVVKAEPGKPISIDPVGAGMSLRDWFAGQALKGLLAFDKDDKGFSTIQDVTKHYADLSYLYADAMLAARLPSPEKEET